MPQRLDTGDRIMHPIRTCLTTEGRIRRIDYWPFVISYAILSILIELVGIRIAMDTTVVQFIFQLLCILPLVTATIKRLHDVGLNAWFVLFMFVPVINIGIFIALMFKGETVDNKYGHALTGYYRNEN